MSMRDDLRAQFRRGSEAAEAAEEAAAPKSARKKFFPNRYAGRCDQCGGWVEANEGQRVRGVGDQWFTRHVEPCSGMPDEPDSEWGPASAKLAADDPQPGIYTLPTEDGHVTLRVWRQGEDKSFAPGEYLIEHLVGPDNTDDYQGFAFLKPGGRVVVWKRHRPSPGKGEAEYVKAARLLAKDPDAWLTAKNCRVCNRLLTTPESIEAGIGPVCGGRGS